MTTQFEFMSLRSLTYCCLRQFCTTNFWLDAELTFLRTTAGTRSDWALLCTGLFVTIVAFLIDAA